MLIMNDILLNPPRVDYYSQSQSHNWWHSNRLIELFSVSAITNGPIYAFADNLASMKFSCIYGQYLQISYRVSCDECAKWDTPFLGHMLTQKAVLLCGDRVLRRILFFEKKIWNFFSKNQIRLNTRSPRKRTACYINICPRKGVSYFTHSSRDTL